MQDRLYLGEEVADGFYESLLNLKTLNKSSLESPDYVDFAAEFENIIEICKNGEKIPPLTEDKSREILMKIKPDVMDLCSMTANHYINAGEPGFRHFQLMLSALISDIVISQSLRSMQSLQPSSSKAMIRTKALKDHTEQSQSVL